MSTSSSSTQQASASAFLRLPTETRLHVYTYLVQRTIEVDLCVRDYPEAHGIPSRKRSPVSNLVTQNLTIESIARSHGLHLLSVCKTTRREVRPLLCRVTVRFHCPRCFEQWVQNVSCGLGVGIHWMKHVQIIFDCGLAAYGGPHRPMTSDLSRFMVTEAMEGVRRTAWLYYGRLDLKQREQWSFKPIPPDVYAPPSPTAPTAAADNNDHNNDPPNQPAPSPHLVDPNVPHNLLELRSLFSHHSGLYPRDRSSGTLWLIDGVFDV